MSYTFDGDATEAANWYPVALTEQQSMMRLGIHSRAYSPVSGVDIVIRTTPPHIHISAGGTGIFITDGEHRIWGVSNSGVLGKEEYYKVLPEYAKIGRGIWGANPKGELDYLKSKVYLDLVNQGKTKKEEKNYAYEEGMGSWCSFIINNNKTISKSSDFVNWDLSEAYWNGNVYISSNKWILAARVIMGYLLIVDGAYIKLIDSNGVIKESIEIPSIPSEDFLVKPAIGGFDYASMAEKMLLGTRARFSPIDNTLYIIDSPLSIIYLYDINVVIKNQVPFLTINYIEKYSNNLFNSFGFGYNGSFHGLVGENKVSANEFRNINFRYPVGGSGFSGRINWREIFR